jgi:hypothetical protein
MRGRIVLAALVLAGCDPLAGSDYVGQPEFTLKGSFASKANAPTSAVGGVALLWQDAQGAGGPGVAATTVPVSISFPAAFDVSVPGPPPEAARFAIGAGEPQLAEAYVYVVADVKAPRQSPRGMDREHVLVWASADVTAGSPSADYLGGPMTAGYHLRRFQPMAAVAPAQRSLIERCVANGAARGACETRRAYQLEAITDEANLSIEVSPP